MNIIRVLGVVLALLPAVACASGGKSEPEPRNFVDFEMAKITANRELKAYHQVIEAEIKGTDGNAASFRQYLYRDGSKVNLVSFPPGADEYEQVSDGKTVWTVSSTQRKYSVTKPIADPVDNDPYDFVLKAPANGFTYDMSDRGLVRFAFSPLPTLLGVEPDTRNGQKLRKVTFTIKPPGAKPTTLTQWFLPDKWILKEFLFDGSGNSGGFTLSGRVTDFETNISIPPDKFKFDPKTVAGFEQVAVPDPNQPPPPPKTFEDFELAKLNAYHDLKRFHEELKFESTIKGKTDTMIRSSIVDRDKFHYKVLVNGEPQIEAISDGELAWLIFHTQKTYIENRSDPLAAFDAKALLARAGPDGNTFSFNPGQPILYASDPTPVFVSNEVVHDGSETLRKVVFKCAGKHGDIVITQWFLEDRYLIKRFLIEGVGEDGPVKVSGEAHVLEFKPRIKDSEFKRDPARIAGYKKTNPFEGSA